MPVINSFGVSSLDFKVKIEYIMLVGMTIFGREIF